MGQKSAKFCQKCAIFGWPGKNCQARRPDLVSGRQIFCLHGTGYRSRGRKIGLGGQNGPHRGQKMAPAGQKLAPGGQKLAPEGKKLPSPDPGPGPGPQIRVFDPDLDPWQTKNPLPGVPEHHFWVKNDPREGQNRPPQIFVNKNFLVNFTNMTKNHQIIDFWTQKIEKLRI